MTKIYKLENKIQDYAWGDYKALDLLFGIKNPENKPQAEIWMGAHPKSPSSVLCGDKAVSLIDFIDEGAEEILGTNANNKFAGKLPFLFKVLSASKPLSIQAHPSIYQAQVGFEHEEEIHLDIAAFNRNYKDANHKPELIYALTPFVALKGFRAIPELLELLKSMELKPMQVALDKFINKPTKVGLIRFYTWLMTLNESKKSKLLREAVAAAKVRNTELPFEIMLYLNDFYPGDIGIMCAVLLNIVQMEPGDAMYVGAGELHAYLKGTGMEIMASSDNVLRGGLTPKHVDVPELLATLTFNSGGVELVKPQLTGRKGEVLFASPAKEFEFDVIEIHGNGFESSVDRSVEILFCGKGQGRILTDCDEIAVKAGESYLVPADAGQYKVIGDVILYKASVPA